MVLIPDKCGAHSLTRSGSSRSTRPPSDLFAVRVPSRLGRRRTGSVFLDPSVGVALRGVADRQRPGRYVLADGRTRAGVRPVPNPNRGDEHVVRAGADVRPDLGPVLVHAVVVRGDRVRADVGLLADLGVADVRQVRDLAAASDDRVLRLDEGADLAPLAEDRARTQVGEGADGGAVADDREGRVDPVHHRAGTDLGVAERGVRPDHRAGGDRRRAHELRPGQDLGVGLDRDVEVDPGRGRVLHGDPGDLVPADDAGVELAGGVGQLRAVVDAGHEPRVGQGDDVDGTAALDDEGGHVGDVLLALGVRGGERRQHGAQVRHVEGVDAGVVLGDGALGVRRVLVLDDADEGAGGVADDAAETGGVVGDRAHERDGVAGVGVQERAERHRVEQRDVAGEHHDGAVEVVGQRLDRDLDRSSGAGDLVLVDDDRVGRALGDLVRDALPLVPDDDGEVLGLERGGRPQHVREEGQAGEPVQHLRGGRLHARALPGGEDDDGDALVGHAPILAQALPSGARPARTRRTHSAVSGSRTP
ncbi:hypothetical protein Cus16_1225 [Curtobacterium sp. ER1/6]|nr:hypothetical protein Cus16_1225 [Curtobacterium sp. ER1/6]